MLRLAVALSILAVALAVAFDIGTLVPHTTVRVSLVDGRQVTVPLQLPTRFVRADPKLLRTLLASEISFANPTHAPDPIPDRVSADQVKDVVVIRGPEYWWWTDSQLTGPAAVFVVSLWIGFYVLRRLVRLFPS